MENIVLPVEHPQAKMSGALTARLRNAAKKTTAFNQKLAIRKADKEDEILGIDIKLGNTKMVFTDNGWEIGKYSRSFIYPSSFSFRLFCTSVCHWMCGTIFPSATDGSVLNEYERRINELTQQVGKALGTVTHYSL